MVIFLEIVLVCSLLVTAFGEENKSFVDEKILRTDDFVFWKYGVVPYYINSKHFDPIQSQVIYDAVSKFNMGTCIQFVPTANTSGHTMVFDNPRGTRKCLFYHGGHSIEGPHRISLGYDCLKSPEIDMILMRGLGFPYEHNRAVRGLYIEVIEENIEPGALDLFAKGINLPKKLRMLPYDYHSISHFGPRDFSKNGHRTIMFKKPVEQKRDGLTKIDLRKIEIVYGPECRLRDRKAQLELCNIIKSIELPPISEQDVSKNEYSNDGDTPVADNDSVNFKTNNNQKLDDADGTGINDSPNALELETDTHLNLNLDRRKRELDSKQAVDADNNISSRFNRRKKDDSIIENGVEQQISWETNEDNSVGGLQKSDHEDKGKEINEKIQENEKVQEMTKEKMEDEEEEKEKDEEKGEEKDEEKGEEKDEEKDEKKDEETDEEKDEEMEKEKVIYQDKNGHKKEISNEETEPRTKKVQSEEIETPVSRERSNTYRKKLPKTVKLRADNKIFYAERRWIDGEVNYQIAPLTGYNLTTDAVRKSLNQVFKILHKHTCVRFTEINDVDAKDEDYVVLDDSPDFVTGKVGGRQHFGMKELFKGGQHKQHTAMVVMAILGFYFEVSRHDRDEYVKLYNRNIQEAKLHHFEKLNEEATIDLPYDYKSATHPSTKFWRKPGLSGTTTLATFKEYDPDGRIMRSLGSNPDLLSESDIIKVNSVYGIDCFT